MNTITRILLALVLLLCSLVTFTTASAQFSRMGRGGMQQQKRVQASLTVYEGDVVAGSTAHVGIVLDVQQGWKIQAGASSGDATEGYIATQIDLSLPEGWSARSVLWPPARHFEMVMGDFREELMIYDGRVVAIIPVTIPSDVEPGEHSISAEIEYQACDDTSCDMPVTITARGSLNIVASTDDAVAATLDSELAELFAATFARYDTHADGESDDADPVAAAGSEDESAIAGDTEKQPTYSGSTFFGFSVPQVGGFAGLMLLALFSALGGLILNLTPCVLPVIPIKIMTLQQHAKHPGKNLVLGLWMFAGVVAFWAGIGLPVAFLTGVTDPSQIFGIWWVTGGIGLLIAVMGIGIIGMFTIQLPQSVYAVNPKADSPGGSFLFGVMTAVLGLPCFGFVAGALLVGAATLPPTTIIVIFTSLGIGMGLPYMVLSAKPSWIEKIPHTGPASELVKQVMGLLLMAAAAYFIGSGLIGLVSERPYLGRQLHWWAAALFAVLAGLWLIVRTFQITPRPALRVLFTVVAVILGGGAVVYATGSTSRAHANWVVQQQAAQVDDSYLAGVWNTYTPAAVEKAREDGKVVVLDFTAEWCLICKALKASVLDRDPVRSALNDANVAKFTVDLTSRTAEGWVFLREGLGQTGIPLLVIYTPGKDEPWQANSYTAQQVLAALESAHNGRIELHARN